MVSINNVEAHREDDGSVTLAVFCPCCNKYKSISIDWTEDRVKAVYRYLLGLGYATDMDFLTPAQREQFISGTCPECWDDMFPREDEHDD